MTNFIFKVFLVFFFLVPPKRAIKKYFENNGKKYFRGTLSFIVGLPGETEETLNSTKTWLLNHWQKNNVVVFALHINNGNSVVKQSKIDADYESYGYTKMSEDEVNLNEKKYFLNSDVENFGASFETNDRLPWKNCNMNMFEALTLSSKIEPELHKHLNNILSKT
jgi:hypothetical protein